MADGTKIEWADATVNAINGCSVTSPGCTNCYAMKLAGTRMKTHPTREGLTIESKAGPVWNGEVRLHEPALLQPLSWSKPRRIFWNAHGDTFHDAVPDEWIDRIFAVAALTPQHTHMILTKRSERMKAFVRDVQDNPIHRTSIYAHGSRMMASNDPRKRQAPPTFPLTNLWLGVSVEDQTRADERIPDLLATPAAVRFLSCEPLLGPVDLQEVPSRVGEDGEKWWNLWSPIEGYCRRHFPQMRCGCSEQQPSIDWVIAGGESGPGARPMHPDWARSLRDQCAAASVPFHFKQWGEFRPIETVANEHGGVDLVPPVSFRNLIRWRRWDGDSARLPSDGETAGEFLEPGVISVPEGKKRAGRLLDGVEHNGMPQVQHG